MTTLFQIDGIGAALSFVAWAMAVAGLKWAIFESFFAMELKAKWQRLEAPKAAELNRIRWEVAKRRRWRPDLADDQQLGDVLSQGEVLDRQARFAELMQTTLRRRALYYFSSCDGCQMFLTSMAVFAATGWPGLSPALFTSLAYAYVRKDIMHSFWEFVPGQGQKKKACTSCGK